MEFNTDMKSNGMLTQSNHPAMKIIDSVYKNYTYLSVQHKSLTGILFLASRIQKHIDNILERYDVTLLQFRIMRQLYRIYPGCIPIYDLKQYLIHKDGDTSRLAQRMVKAGQIEKITSPEDRRMVYVKITPKGRELMDKIIKHEPEFLVPVNVLNDQEAELMNEFIERILEEF